MREAAARTRRLLRSAEAIAYWLAAAPLLALLPARLAYGAACWRADLVFRSWPEKHGEVAGNLRQVLGEQLLPNEAERLARDVFRIRSCEVIDLMRLRGRARSLGKLVEIRGREHLDAALAAGKGAILCSAHFGSYDCAFSAAQCQRVSRLPASGAGGGITRQKGRPPCGGCGTSCSPGACTATGSGPNIEPWPGRVQVALQAAAVLRGNEVVTILQRGPAARRRTQSRTIEVPFLGAGRPGSCREW